MLAANLVVPTDHVDSSVLMGFRPEDIVKEIRRGGSLVRCFLTRFFADRQVKFEGMLGMQISWGDARMPKLPSHLSHAMRS